MAAPIPWHPKPEWQPTFVLRKVPQVIPSSTTPSLVVTDAGNGYIKMPVNPQGPAALVSELVGTMLADWLTDPSTQSRLAEFITGRALYVADSIERKLFPQGELNL